MEAMESSDELLNMIAETEGIGNPEITLKPSFTPGEGFLGTYQVANVRGKQKCLNLFVKRPPPTEDETIGRTMRTIYLNEILFYETIYPEFRKFEQAKGCRNIFKSVAKCYKTISDRNKEVIVLDDMKVKGYKSYNKKEPLDGTHMELIFEEIAHFHAVSFAFKDQKPKQFKEMVDHICCVNIQDAKIDFENTVEYITKYSLESLNPTRFYGYEIFKYFTDTVRQFLNSVDALSEDFTVIIHGDITNNNILFYYQDEQNPNTPTNVCFFDWQLIRATSPVIDLSYMFYGMCNSNQMENIEYYLEFYYEKLRYYTRNLGSDADVLYPWNKFKQQWRLRARYGLALSFLVIKMMLTEPDDIPMGHTPSIKKTMLETLSYQFKNEEQFKERIKFIIGHFIQRGYLEPLEKYGIM